MWKQNHQINFERTSVLLDQETNTSKQYLLEFWYIKRSDTFNREAGPLATIFLVNLKCYIFILIGWCLLKRMFYKDHILDRLFKGLSGFALLG